MSDWLKTYQDKTEYLSEPYDFNIYFKEKEINGRAVSLLEIGEVNVPTGEVFVCDPLTFLTRDQKPYFLKTPIGKFPLTIVVVEVEENHHRYVGFRVKFSDKEAISYKLALKGDEDLASMEMGEFFGFNVDAGLATFVDVKTRDAFCDFEEKWHRENSEASNIYDDFFAALFAKNARNNPKFQREYGDWILFQIPDTELSVPMIQSGFGDGTYPAYFGFDSQGAICELFVEFIDATLPEEE
ncbi:DUF4241 domain-containing protein [Capnocytophaga sp.]|uniref:DUF4241 domain-containing protein n=1 Tax=Capnocytophaga sp. TaxID=44737 RepID=UPI0026DAD3DF|nr:DUF4241 domain-containing protein [Capnocytophaga sp.]MDO5106161.1 DUF4241 domain-containing protein [Capnocytophaga sp.]